MTDNVCTDEDKPKHVTLPPISSFDNLIKAAERKYMGEDPMRSKDSFNFGSLGANRNNSGILTYQFLSVSPFVPPSRIQSKVDLGDRTQQLNSPSSSAENYTKGSITATTTTIRNGDTVVDSPVDPLDNGMKTQAVPFLKPTWSSLNDSEPSSSQSSANVSSNITRSNSEAFLSGAAAIDMNGIAFNRTGNNAILLPRHSVPANGITLGKSPTSTFPLIGGQASSNVSLGQLYPTLTPTSPELMDNHQQNVKHASISYFSGDAKENTTGAEQRRKSETPGRVTKKRKRRECPVCHGFFANLTTHKATHLEPDDKPFMCPVCKRGFVRQNDLIRHQKMHWKDKLLVSPKDSPHNNPTSSGDANISEKEHLKSLHCMKGTYECPYNTTLIDLDLELYPYKDRNLPFEPMKCHRTGVFSRCDTFKNHLKALHFEYPVGTKRSERKHVPGKCKHCGHGFNNVEDWFNNHVGKECGYSYHESQ